MKKFNLGKTLKMLIEANGMSIEKFAQAIGVDEETVDHYIYDEVSPSKTILKNMAKALGVSVEFLLNWNDQSDSSDNSTFKMAYLLIKNHMDEWSENDKKRMIKKLLSNAEVSYTWKK